MSDDDKSKTVSPDTHPSLRTEVTDSELIVEADLEVEGEKTSVNVDTLGASTQAAANLKIEDVFGEKTIVAPPSAPRVPLPRILSGPKRSGSTSSDVRTGTASSIVAPASPAVRAPAVLDGPTVRFEAPPAGDPLPAPRLRRPTTAPTSEPPNFQTQVSTVKPPPVGDGPSIRTQGSAVRPNLMSDGPSIRTQGSAVKPNPMSDGPSIRTQGSAVRPNPMSDGPSIRTQGSAVKPNPMSDGSSIHTRGNTAVKPVETYAPTVRMQIPVNIPMEGPTIRLAPNADISDIRIELPSSESSRRPSEEPDNHEHREHGESGQRRRSKSRRRSRSRDSGSNALMGTLGALALVGVSVYMMMFRSSHPEIAERHHAEVAVAPPPQVVAPPPQTVAPPPQTVTPPPASLPPPTITEAALQELDQAFRRTQDQIR